MQFLLLFARMASVCWLKQCVLTCSSRAVSMLCNASSGCRQITAIAVVQLTRGCEWELIHAETQDLAFVMYTSEHYLAKAKLWPAKGQKRICPGHI